MKIVTLFVFFIPTLTMYLCCVNDIPSIITAPVGAVVSHSFNCSALFERVRPCLDDSDLSCRYLELIEERYPLQIFTDYDEAYSLGKKGKLSAIIQIHENFTESLVERLEKQSKASNESIEAATLYVTMDMADVFIMVFITIDHIYKSLQQVCREVCLACGIDVRFTRIPIEFQEPPIHGDLNGPFITGYLPGVVCPFVFYVTFVFTSTALMMERTSGLLERIQIAGLTLPEILVAQIVIQLLIVILQNFFLFSICYIIYDNIIIGSFALVYFITLMCEMFGMAYGILLACVMDKELLLAYAGVGTMLATFFLCGSIWPIEGQHWLLYSAAKFFPLTHAAVGYFDVSVRGFGLGTARVALGLFSPLFGSILLLLVCYGLYRRNIIII